MQGSIRYFQPVRLKCVLLPHSVTCEDEDGGQASLAGCQTAKCDVTGPCATGPFMRQTEMDASGRRLVEAINSIKPFTSTAPTAGNEDEV